MRPGNEKPYFSTSQIEAVVENFKSSTTEQKIVVDDAIVSKVRTYVNARKNIYENALLRGVMDGHYNISMVDNRVAFAMRKLVASTELTDAEKLEVDTKNTAIMNDRADKLNVARSLIARYGKKDSGLLVQ